MTTSIKKKNIIYKVCKPTTDLTVPQFKLAYPFFFLTQTSPSKKNNNKMLLPRYLFILKRFN